jgi:hypothetical protein
MVVGPTQPVGTGRIRTRLKRLHIEILAWSKKVTNVGIVDRGHTPAEPGHIVSGFRPTCARIQAFVFASSHIAPEARHNRK